MVVLSSKNSNVCYLEISIFSSSFASFFSYLSLLAVSNMSTGEGTSMSAKLEKVLRAVRDIESKVDDKLLAVKREMKSADDRLVKKIRLDTKPTYKKRGHENINLTSNFEMLLPPRWSRLLPPWRRLALASKKVRN